jgi:acetyl esterase/lipase
MGFSAGAFVTMYSIMNSKPGKQPDFGAPIYGGSLNGLNVPDNAPPVFIACAADDRIAANSPDIFKAWREAGKSAELHIYSKGGHGFGLSPGNMPVNTWIDRFYEWLKISGF